MTDEQILQGVAANMARAADLVKRGTEAERRGLPAQAVEQHKQGGKILRQSLVAAALVRNPEAKRIVVNQLQALLKQWEQLGLERAEVPTMGAGLAGLGAKIRRRPVPQDVPTYGQEVFGAFLIPFVGGVILCSLLGSR